MAGKAERGKGKKSAYPCRVALPADLVTCLASNWPSDLLDSLSRSPETPTALHSPVPL